MIPKDDRVVPSECAVSGTRYRVYLTSTGENLLNITWTREENEEKKGEEQVEKKPIKISLRKYPAKLKGFFPIIKDPQ